MQTLEQISARINITQALGGVVRTMKALSAVTVRQYEEAAASVAVYYRTVELGLAVVLRDYQAASNQRGAPVRLGVVAVGSDQGLCGRFNSDIVARARTELQGAGPDTKILAVGDRVASKLGAETELAALSAPASVGGVTQTVEQILDQIDTWQNECGINTVQVVHNRTADGHVYQTRSSQLVPVEPHRFESARARKWPTRMVPLYTMNQDVLLRSLVRQYFFVSVFRAVAESVAAEHTARLAVLSGAARNIDEYLEDLQGAYRQRRQAGITSELMDLFSGFEALGGGADMRVTPDATVNDG